MNNNYDSNVSNNAKYDSDTIIKDIYYNNNHLLSFTGEVNEKLTKYEDSL